MMTIFPNYMMTAEYYRRVKWHRTRANHTTQQLTLTVRLVSFVLCEDCAHSHVTLFHSLLNMILPPFPQHRDLLNMLMYISSQHLYTHLPDTPYYTTLQLQYQYILYTTALFDAPCELLTYLNSYRHIHAFKSYDLKLII